MQGTLAILQSEAAAAGQLAPALQRCLRLLNVGGGWSSAESRAAVQQAGLFCWREGSGIRLVDAEHELSPPKPEVEAVAAHPDFI